MAQQVRRRLGHDERQPTGTLLVEPRVILVTAAVFALAIAYFALYSRHHIVQGAPEEEFAAQKARILAG